MKKLVSLFLVLALSIGLLAACSSSTSTSSQGGASGTADTSGAAGGGHTVTFYDGNDESVLDTKTVADGDVVPEYVPEKDGATFVGWYMTPTMTHPLNPTQTVTENLSLYAGFVTYQEDTRDFYILGNGTSPLLLASAWGGGTDDRHKLVKQDVDGVNEYSITLDLAVGDEWQIAMDTAWNNQRGWGYLADPGDNFTGSGSLGDSGAKKSNIKVEVAGNYTITLTTYPAEDWYDEENEYYADNPEAHNYSNYDTIAWVRNGDMLDTGSELLTRYYIKGATVTGWEDVYDDTTRFTEENGIHTLTIDLEAGDTFLFTSTVDAGDGESVGTEYIRYSNIAEDDADSLALVTHDDSYNMIVADAGTYTFAYDPATETLTVSVG